MGILFILHAANGAFWSFSITKITTFESISSMAYFQFLIGIELINNVLTEKSKLTIESIISLLSAYCQPYCQRLSL